MGNCIHQRMSCRELNRVPKAFNGDAREHSIKILFLVEFSHQGLSYAASLTNSVWGWTSLQISTHNFWENSNGKFGQTEQMQLQGGLKIIIPHSHHSKLTRISATAFSQPTVGRSQNRVAKMACIRLIHFL